MDIYTMPPKEEKVVMTVEETKKCRIVPQKNRFVPDLLLRNKRIVEETTMEINKAEIARAMSIAEVYLVNKDGSETLLTPFNFCVSIGKEAESGGDNKEPETPAPNPTTPSQPEASTPKSSSQSTSTDESNK